jgi:hypothetical protein
VELKQWPDADSAVAAADTAVPGATMSPEALNPQDSTTTEP